MPDPQQSQLAVLCTILLIPLAAVGLLACFLSVLLTKMETTSVTGFFCYTLPGQTLCLMKQLWASTAADKTMLWTCLQLWKHKPLSFSALIATCLPSKALKQFGKCHLFFSQICGNVCPISWRLSRSLCILCGWQDVKAQKVTYSAGEFRTCTPNPSTCAENVTFRPIYYQFIQQTTVFLFMCR